MKFGVSVLCKCGQNLVEDRMRKPFTARVSELQFANDLTAVSTIRESMENVSHILDDYLKEWGMTWSIVKTKLLVAGERNADDVRPLVLRLNDAEVECVTEFKYLGFTIEAKGGIAH